MRKLPAPDQIAATVRDLLDELHAAALCYGAVHHPSYTDTRLAELRRKHEQRLESAAKKYHAYVVALGFVSRAK